MRIKTERTWLDFILKEWLLFASCTGLIFTSLYFRHLPSWSISELEVLFILFTLFVAVKGLENSGLILKVSQGIEEGKFIPLKLVVTTFFLSMVVTNDIALIVMVPLTLMLRTKRKDVIIILEALSANAGSSLMPFGNPQNLFIYWYYGIKPEKFIITIAPFSLLFLILFVLISLAIKTDTGQKISRIMVKISFTSYIYGILFVIVILTALRVLPIAAGFLVIIYAFIFDRKSLRIDYALLFCFFCFFGLATNMKILLSSTLESSRHVFLFSAISSQFMSNVPATLLFAKFTTQWRALLWGVNVGGFGNLVGSLANLIAYKLYITHKETNNNGLFTIKFLIFGYAMFLLGIGLYWVIEASL